MKQLLRRLTSLLLAMAMVMSLAFTAAAADMSNDSSADTSSLSEQEIAPDLEAEDLSTIINETEVEESEQSDGSAEEENQDSSASQTGEEETAEEVTDSQQGEEEETAQAEEPKEAEKAEEAEETEEQAPAQESEQPQSETEAEVEVQAAGSAGWDILTENNQTHFTLSYRSAGATDDTSLTQAKSSFVFVPAQEKVSIGGSTYTFNAGVYQFDGNGYLVESASVNGAPADTNAVLAVENGALTAQSVSQLKFTVTGTQVQKSSASGVTTIAPFTQLYTGKNGSTYYYEGALYNGYFRENENSDLMMVTNGVAAAHNGRMHEKVSPNYLIGFQKQEGKWYDNHWYYNGKPYTGYFRADDASDPAAVYVIKEGAAVLLNGQLKANDVYDTFLDNYKVDNSKINNRWHVQGKVFTGFYQNPGSKRVYLLNNGVIVEHKNKKYAGKHLPYTGLMKNITLDGVTYTKFAKMGKEIVNTDGLYYQIGLPLTGIPSVKPTDDKLPALYMYKQGVRQKMKDGWYRAPRAEADFYKPYVYYYFKGNKALTGENKRLQAIQSGKYKDKHYYYYTFRDNGTLVTNLVAYKPTILKTGKFRIYCDHTTYTGTILMYNSKSKKYDIPVKSFVVAMSRKKSSSSPEGTKYGNYTLASGHSTWYHYKSPRFGTWCWYSSSVHIWGSGSMFHSSNYKDFKKSASQKTRRHKMTAHIYNQIGTGVTQHCVRSFTINIRLITQLYKSSSKFKNHGRSCSRNVRVYLSKSTTNNYMPFGRMTMLNNCDINGYILERANGYGYGKDCAFDPTDHYCIKETIYICKKKTSKKADCTKVKMTRAYQYQLTYEKA